MGRKSPARSAPLVRDALPSFAIELARLLDREAPELARQLDGLQLVGRCRCGQSDCATFHVLTDRAASAIAGYGPQEVDCIDMEPESGLIVVDIKSGRLESVEVLGRPDVKRELDAVIPPLAETRLP